MEKPLVSILIPVKNAEDYLLECITSILEQSYTNFEILAIDDNSTDTSKTILDTLVDKDARVHVFSNTNSGIITALRLAYAKCKGDYITRMDADDIMMPQRLEVMVRNLQENGFGHLAVGKVRYFSKNGIGNGYARYENWLNKLTEKGDNFKEIYKECVIPSPCWMVHKNDFEDCGAFFSDRYPEDYDLAFRFYKNGLKVIRTKEILHQWRDYSTRTSRTSEHYAENYFLDIKLYYFLELDYIADRPLVVWGAGAKGKKIAKALTEKNIKFTWVCDNAKKIGKTIYENVLYHFSELENISNYQCIITVANEMDQQEILSFLDTKKQGLDYFLFC